MIRIRNFIASLIPARLPEPVPAKSPFDWSKEIAATDARIDATDQINSSLRNGFKVDARHYIKRIDEIQQSGKAPKARSIVGATVMTLSTGRHALLLDETRLTAEIEERTEKLRQTKRSLVSINHALTEIASDPALSDDERAMAEAPITQIAVEAAAADQAELSTAVIPDFDKSVVFQASTLPKQSKRRAAR